MPAHLTQSQNVIIEKAMAEPGFRRRLLDDPAAAIRDAGLVVPEGMTFTVLEDTATHLHLVLPPRLDEGDLSDGDLDGVAGGLWRNLLAADFSQLLRYPLPPRKP